MSDPCHATLAHAGSDRRSHRDTRHDALFRRLLKACALLVLVTLLGAALATLWDEYFRK